MLPVFLKQGRQTKHRTFRGITLEAHSEYYPCEEQVVEEMETFNTHGQIRKLFILITTKIPAHECGPVLLYHAEFSSNNATTQPRTPRTTR